jgi:hypothetical protein
MNGAKRGKLWLGFKKLANKIGLLRVWKFSEMAAISCEKQTTCVVREGETSSSSNLSGFFLWVSKQINFCLLIFATKL